MDSALRLLHSSNYKIPKVQSFTCNYSCTYKTYFPIMIMIIMMINTITLIILVTDTIIPLFLILLIMFDALLTCIIYFILFYFILFYFVIENITAILFYLSVFIKNICTLLKSFDAVEDEHAKNMGRWRLSEVQVFCDGIRRYVRIRQLREGR